MTKRETNVWALNAADNEKTSAMITAVNSVVDRLEQVLGEENAVLEAGKPARLEQFIAQKSQLLNELLALEQALNDHRVFVKTGPRLQSVRALVEKNHALLRLQAEGFGQFMKPLANVAKH